MKRPVIILTIFTLFLTVPMHGQTVVLKAELLLDTRSELGEGAVWHPENRELWWVDIEQGYFHVFDPATGKNTTIKLGQKVGTVVPTTTGDALLALHDGIYAYRFSDERLKKVAPNPENATTGNRFNDGKCDPGGRFWVGTMGANRSGALYRMDADSVLRIIRTGVGTSNGIVWSLDKKVMYHIDTDTRKVTAYDYNNQPGEVVNPRDAIVIPHDMGAPDGSTLDSEGMIWIAHWGGGCVTRWNPTNGELLCKVEVPAALVTSCAFGGENLDTLFITTARIGVKGESAERYPYSGGLFFVKPGVKGIKANMFIGTKKQP